MLLTHVHMCLNTWSWHICTRVLRIGLKGEEMRRSDELSTVSDQSDWARNVTPSVLHYKSFTKTLPEHHIYVLIYVI